MSSYNHDEISEALSALHMPEPRSNAQERILYAAKRTARPKRTWLAKLRRLRALIYVPQTRYAIMASVVGVMILAGALNTASGPAGAVIPDDLLLYDLEFATFDPSAVWMDSEAG